MPRNINPVPKFTDNLTGAPLAFGEMFYFESGTDTPKATFADINLTIQNANPVLLTADGSLPNVFFNGVARQKLTTTAGMQQWDKDPVGDQRVGADFEAWVPQVVYSVNDIVEGSDGNFYISFTNGNENNDPTTSTAFWEQIDFVHVWNPNVTYDLGDFAKASDNNIYKSLITNNIGNDPISSPSEWGTPILLNLSSPPPIGDVAPNTIAGTTLDLAALSGIIEINTTFVAMAEGGPFVDSVDWTGKTAAPTSDRMLVTVEDAGADTQVNIWDFAGASLTGLTPLATVIITGAAAVTSVAFAMGYIIVGHEDGITIIDPHDGAWQERTEGWPRSLSTATFPTLTNNDIAAVGAGFAQMPIHDSRTGGPMPSFAIGFGAGTDAFGVMKDNGTFFSRSGAPSSGRNAVAIENGLLYGTDGNFRLNASDILIDQITADDYALDVVAAPSGGFAFGLSAPTVMDTTPKRIVYGAAGGLTIIDGQDNTGGGTGISDPVHAIITKDYNTGYFTSALKALWISNSKTIDRSPRLNTLTENGTVTLAAVETGAELQGVSGFAATPNSLTRASDADWDVVGTGAFYTRCWFKSLNNTTEEQLCGFGNATALIRFGIVLEASGKIKGEDDGGTPIAVVTDGLFDDGKWHKVELIRISSTERHLVVDGKLEKSSTGNAGSLSSSGNLPYAIGIRPATTSNPALTSTISEVHISATPPSFAQSEQMYEAERGRFETNAKCLLQSGTTDAVLDVSVDPINGKVMVTQTDSQVIFNGLVVETEETLAGTGANFERGLLYDADTVQINDANLSAAIAVKSGRGIAELVRGMKAGLPAGVDLGKLKAALIYNRSTSTIVASFNIKSVANGATGIHTATWGVPFKLQPFVVGSSGESLHNTATNATAGISATLRVRNDAGTDINVVYTVILAFGELENE